jgi:hypothetical protein
MAGRFAANSGCLLDAPQQPNIAHVAEDGPPRPFQCPECTSVGRFSFHLTLIGRFCPTPEGACSNTQVRADILENEIWENVSKILRNPKILNNVSKT